MAQTFIGFNTQGQFKKFTLTGFELIKRDLLNAFNIRQGQLPGRPAYGTVLWDFLFENQVEQVSTNIVNEVQRVAGGDPRIQITDVQIYPQLNGILIELELEVLPAPTLNVWHCSLILNNVEPATYNYAVFACR
jgi:phage baseplate assembly protein W